MGLSVIGAGFGRTGTDSMKLALEILGFGPCHHMKEVNTPQQRAIWRAAAKGEIPDWDEAFAGYRSAVDWPAAHFWRELAGHFPDAKILLTVRSPESWYESASRTIFKAIGRGGDPDSVGEALVKDRVFGGRFDDPELAIAIYERNNEEVQAAFGPDRLLVYPLGAGWEPLCAFLGVPVPDDPYPHRNTTSEFETRLAR